jgi:hypothetical protein
LGISPVKKSLIDTFHQPFISKNLHIIFAFLQILVALSTAAREHGIYLVVNLQEEMDCHDAPGEYCPVDRTYLFNTNVVFDRTGAVIDRQGGVFFLLTNGQQHGRLTLTVK